MSPLFSKEQRAFLYGSRRDKYQLMNALKLQSSAELIHFAIKNGIVSICSATCCLPRSFRVPTK